MEVECEKDQVRVGLRLKVLVEDGVCEQLCDPLVDGVREPEKDSVLAPGLP